MREHRVRSCSRDPGFGRAVEAHVVRDVEAVVVDPYRSALAERHIHEPAAKARDEVEPGRDERTGVGEPEPTGVVEERRALEHTQRPDVHGRLEPFEVEEARVERTQSVVVPHGAIVGAPGHTGQSGSRVRSGSGLGAGLHSVRVRETVGIGTDLFAASIRLPGRRHVAPRDRPARRIGLIEREVDLREPASVVARVVVGRHEGAQLPRVPCADGPSPSRGRLRSRRNHRDRAGTWRRWPGSPSRRSRSPVGSAVAG